MKIIRFLIVGAAMVALISLSLVFSNTSLPTTQLVVPVEVESTVLPEETLTTIPTPKSVVVRPLELKQANISYLLGEVSSLLTDLVITDIRKFNAKNNNPIYLILDSPGGSVMAGAKLIAIIQSSKNPIYAVNTGSCASMCFMILQHSHKRLALDRTTLMVHPASLQLTYAGQLDNLVSRVTYMKHFVDRMDRSIAKRARVSYEKFKLLTQQELWIDSIDSLNMGLLDEIVSFNLPSISEPSPNSGSSKLKEDFNLE